MRRIGFILTCYLISIGGYSQEYSLIASLNEIAEQSELSFSYDAELLEEITTYKPVASIAELEALLESSALRIRKVADGEYLIVPYKSTIQFRFQSAEGHALDEFYVDVIRGNNEVLYQNFVGDPQNPISFEWMPRPNDTIKVISTAHDPVAIPLNQLLFQLNQGVTLKEKVTYLDEVIIENYLAKGINLDVPNQVTTLKMEELALIPGETDGDVLASLATLPGINSPDSRAGNLFIRGSSADQNLMLYNNIPIYHRGHYFGSISPYNPAVISNVSVSKNGYNPRLGGRVGGAIEISSQDQLEEYSAYGAGINSLYGNAFMKTRLGKKVGISIAGRHSLPSGFISPKLVQISDMVYSATALTDPQNSFDLSNVDVNYEDYNFNVLWEVNENHSIKLSTLYTNNLTNYVIKTDTSESEEAFSFDNIGVSMEWKHAINEKMAGKFVGFYSDYQTRYVKEDDDPMGISVSVDGSDNQVSDAGLSYELGIRMKGNKLTFGAATQWTEVLYLERAMRPNQPPVFVRGKESSIVHALYSNYQYNGLGRFYFQFGGRLDYYTRNSTPYFSPRLLMNYDVSSQLTMKASAGRYYQYLNQIKNLQFGNAGFDNELWRLAGNGNIKTLHSDQLMVGGILTKGAWVLDVEAYKKQINNVNYSTTYQLNPRTDYEQAQWNVAGFDLFSKVQVSNGFSLWGSYEYSEQTFAFDSAESIAYTYKYNRPHRFKLGGLYQHGRWKISFSWKILSGLYGRSLDIVNELDRIVVRELVVPPPPPGGPGPGGPPPGGPPPPRIEIRPITLEEIPERYPTFRSLDVFVTYELPKTASRKWSANFGLSLINVFHYANQIDQVTRGNATQLTLLERNAIGFAPNLNISIKW